MSAAPDELPEPVADEPDAELVDGQPSETPIQPSEFADFELEALGLLRTHPDVSRTPDWIGRLSTHIESGAAAPRPKDYVRALKRAPERVMVRSVGSVGVSDYRYDPDEGVVVQRAYSEGFRYDSGPDEPIRVKKISEKQAEDLLRDGHLMPRDHWGVDLEQEFERYRQWQEAQR